ncbi:transposase-like protein [Angulomicrobium tetraedrale]|uniref:Transposase-like protein n=1 Tax=Ancylobacter tetraedralis TaxID=217068 RepID=A0A839Z640_9HYPH|nr:hypothetical protein [Ancylobacter tetraedralis]MBB3769796.1 transposase-like protein [Ancylobacter tetraedralis]
MAQDEPAISPAELSEARRLYEETDAPVAEIAKLLGVTGPGVYRQASRRGWKRRRPARATAVPPARPAPRSPAAAAGRTARTGRRRAVPRGQLITRLVKRIEKEIAAVERLIARVGRERPSDGVAETERAARTLAILVRSLRELAALERAEPEGDEDDAELRDADAFRRELGETLERVLAAGKPA